MESGEGEDVNIEELASNLSTYKDQLQQVRKLLKDEPNNSEYLDMAKELAEVIELTEELLATARQSDSSVPLTGTIGEASPNPHLPESSLHFGVLPKLMTMIVVFYIDLLS
ncbi:survival of motor neuron-related-splicing factor 30 [Phtheirospermum japonicum]|uniref:Survival of motor neuron-related-splicing factor 30 n=1 Tax=Phtheirospermum japonicum TaxID=374723 RepID=A0A830C748_9LAMI|nr:survival of motor neuron-related-splicing factor 30 [Phtheirospermum japonicum]